MKQDTLIRKRVIFFLTIACILAYGMHLSLKKYIAVKINITQAKVNHKFTSTKFDDFSNWLNHTKIQIIEETASQNSVAGEKYLRVIKVNGAIFYKLQPKSINLDNNKYLSELFNSKKSLSKDFMVKPPCDNDLIAVYFHLSYGSHVSSAKKFFFESEDYFVFLTIPLKDGSYQFIPEYMIEKKSGLSKSVIFNF